MKHRDIAALMAGMAPVIKDYVSKVTCDVEAVSKHVDQLTVRIAELTARLDTALDAIQIVREVPGETGERGEQGPVGPAGDAGPAGEKGDPGEPGAAGVPGTDGAPGLDGRDGTPGLDGKDGADGAPGPQGERGLSGEKGLDGAPGRDGRDGLPGVQGEKGLDGKDGRDGIDGLGFDDLRLEFDGERTVTFIFERGERIERASIKFPIMLYRGVWRDGVAYERGDTVSYGGSSWHANVDTNHKPEISKDWQLMTKRGRDGKDGKDGDRGKDGPAGPPGLNGRTSYGA